MGWWDLPSSHIDYLNILFTFFNCREFVLQSVK
jgi:hypothetical protein